MLFECGYCVLFWLDENGRGEKRRESRQDTALLSNTSVVIMMGCVHRPSTNVTKEAQQA
jgi:hypothetical protein